MKVLLLIVIAVTPSWQLWWCGDVYIASDKECECGNTTITRDDRKGCCGTVQCAIGDITGQLGLPSVYVTKHQPDPESDSD